MNTISSAAFRKTYPTIKEPTIVTVNGHPIGYWDPRVVTTGGAVLQPTTTIFDDGQGGQVRRTEHGAAQANRDAILRRINKGG